MTSESSLSPTQERINIAQILVALWDNKKSMTNREISSATGIKESWVSVVVKDMERYGYLEVERGTFLDKRKNKVRLTQLGEGQAVSAKISMYLVQGRNLESEMVVSWFKKVERIFKKG